jgi:hypothetical protein
MNKIKKIEQFLKVLYKDDEFKGSHNIHTPLIITDSITSKISLKNKSILVLFNVEFVTDLLYNKKVKPSQITFYSDHNKKTELVRLFGVKKIINTINEAHTSMKFDVVIGNPPYQDPSNPSRKVWIEIILKSFDLVKEGGVLCMITPNSWILRPDGQKFKKVSELFSKYQLKFVDLISPNNYFNVGEDIGYWILESKSKYESTPIYATWDGSIDTKKIDFIGQKIEFSNNDKLKFSIIKKVLNSSEVRMPFESELSSDRGIEQLVADGTISLNKTKEFSQEVFWTASQTYYTNTKIAKLGVRLILNRSGYFFKDDQIDKYMPIKKDVAIGIGGYGLSFNSIKEADHARKLLSSKIIRLFVEGQKTSGFNTALTKLPKFDLTMPVKKLSEYFGLTSEEIDYLEFNVK